MGRLYLIRHAQSPNNQNWTGSDFHPDREPDPDITERGHFQARALAAHLADPIREPRQYPFLAPFWVFYLLLAVVLIFAAFLAARLPRRF